MMNPRKFFAALCALVLALTAGACLVACGESERDQPIDKIALTENAADYKKLQELTEENDRLDESLAALYEAWGQLSE